MKQLIIAFLIVFSLQVTINKPALPQVQAQETKQIEAPRAKEKKRVVKDATKVKKPVKKAPVVAKSVPKPAPVPTGSCSDWIRAAGISDVASASELIRRESGCNPNAINPSSGACGISQSLPCSKMGGVNSDGTSAVSPVQQIIWMQNYVMARYGSWQSAVNWHDTHNWY